MMSAGAGRRRAGLLIPLFSFPSSTSWGIGDIGDLAPMTAWLAAAGQRVLQLLPLNEMASGQQSPYSAISAMAIDPVYIRMAAVADFADAGGETALDQAERATLEEVRRAPYVNYADVRRLKRAALAWAFQRFHEREWCRDTARARAFREFATAQAWWLDDYALFRAIRDLEGQPWTTWREPLQRRDAATLDAVRHEHSRDVLFYQYLQWLAGTQWEEARAAAGANGVELFGDLPFMVDADSADVWARQHQFHLDISVGAPPDAFSATGQDWGMPAYRWDVVAADDFRWLRDRARRSADLFDGYRVDHLVGFYRTYGRPRSGGEPLFMPAEHHEQIALGERVLAVFREPGAEVIAEDLGTVPEFVRESLARAGVPGFCVLRWERLWHVEGQPFRDPAAYPHVSVAASGTHDTEPMAMWWEHASDDERAKVSRLPTVQRLAGDRDLASASYSPDVRDVLLRALFDAASNLLLLPVQDVFGWRDRVNQPATVDDGNWTFRLPWPCDRMKEIPEALERQVALRAWAGQSGRG